VPATAEAPITTWVTLRAACQVAGKAGTYAVMKAALLGAVRYRAEIGRNLLFCREDVEAMARATEGR
jgi:hypothetical protein